MFNRVGIIAKTKVENIGKIVLKLHKYLSKLGIKVVLGNEIATAVNKPGTKREDIPQKVDLVIVLGGDGTFISAARAISESESDIPILGVNLGRMGFLTEVPLQGMNEALSNVFEKGHFIIEKRMMIDVTLTRPNNKTIKKTVFNDAVINKGALARIISVKTSLISGTKMVYIATYHADGLIVSTPSGSTAYNLAAGGPIVFPTLDSFILTPICPHTLSNRPIVIPHNSKLMIEFNEKIEDVFLTLDGQMGFSLKQKDKILLEKSSKSLKLIAFKEKNYFEILRTKLGWEERKVRYITDDK